MTHETSEWLERIGRPEASYQFERIVRQGPSFDYPDFVCESYFQANGPGTIQRILMAVPKARHGLCPAVAVPFYYPEAMLGERPSTGEKLPKFAGMEMLAHLAKRGFIAASAESYHLTYLPESTQDIDDFRRWGKAAEKLKADHPHWSGIGKLVADTQLLIDLLADDPRTDSARIGIAGHSLGGKMAFYTGCLDDRIRVILASDFGMNWNQTNWDAPWYWGADCIKTFKADNIDHASLMRGAACKPFALLAGENDNEDSLDAIRRAGYDINGPSLCFINHATGHRPPKWALDRAYGFLENHLNIPARGCF